MTAAEKTQKSHVYLAADSTAMERGTATASAACGPPHPYDRGVTSGLAIWSAGSAVNEKRVRNTAVDITGLVTVGLVTPAAVVVAVGTCTSSHCSTCSGAVPGGSGCHDSSDEQLPPVSAHAEPLCTTYLVATAVPAVGDPGVAMGANIDIPGGTLVVVTGPPGAATGDSTGDEDAADAAGENVVVTAGKLNGGCHPTANGS